MVIHYRIARIRWRQKELTYEEFLKVMELLRGQFTAFAGNEEAVGELAERLAKEGTLPKLFGILLEPHARTPLGAAIDRRRMRRAGITRDTICNRMTLREIAAVLTHFFVLNVGWIDNWMSSAIASIGTGAMLGLKAGSVLSRLKKRFTTLLKGTSEPPSITGDSTPSPAASGPS